MRDQADPLRETPAGAVDASPMAVSVARLLTISLVAGIFLGLIAPLGTIELPLALRLGYWIIAMVGGSLLGWAATLLVMRWRRARENAWLMIVAIAVVMTPPGVVLVWLWGRVAVPDEAGFGDPITLTWAVFLISLVMTAINRLIAPSEVAAPAAIPAAAPAPAEPKSALLERLPPRLRGSAILAVEAEDHYLRVHTSGGSDLILLRLSDALSELAGLDGAQTHRSWWVARAAVRDAARGDGRATLTLEGGLRVPVSRAYAPGLRAAGWF
jgi:DNA-binding LytR/AlgR family response regulator